MDCAEAKTHLLDFARADLLGEMDASARTHFAGCAECSKRVAAERATDDMLARAPRYQAPASFVGQLEKLAVGKEAADSMRPREPAPRATARGGGKDAVVVFVAALAAAASFAVGTRFGPPGVQEQPEARLDQEAANDHLRLLYGQHPVEIESGGIHQVKPWFSGRLDFAPVIGFEGDDEFSLKGGAVAYFIDRKAAAFEYAYKLHHISLFVFRADGFAFSERGSVPMGRVEARVDETRGFHVVLWHNGDLGYALVSDASQDALLRLGANITQ